MFTTLAVATAFLGLAACSKNEPAPTEAAAPAAVTAPADNASAPAAAPAEAGSAKPADSAPVQPK